MAGYTHRVCFSKKFLTGNLAGLTVTDQGYGVCDIRTAQADVKRMLDNPHNRDCVTRSKFVYVDPYIVALED